MPIYRRCGVCGKKILVNEKCDCRKDIYKRYDKNVRYNKDNIIYAKFYNSKQWKKMSEYIKTKYNGICLMCFINYGLFKFADMVHHIEPIRDNWERRLDENNLIPLCNQCHNNIDHKNYTDNDKERLRLLINEYKEKYM